MSALLALALLQQASPAKPVPLNRSAWITADDYPAVSVRNAEQGKVGYRLTIATDGRVTACEIVASSGFGNLDEKACLAIKVRARFQPGLPGTYDGALTWTLPPSEKPASPDSSGVASMPAPAPYPTGARPIRIGSAGRSLLRSPAPSLAELSRLCAIGSAPPTAGSNPSTYSGEGVTPIAIPGAVTVSAAEAKCVLDRFPGAVLVADATGEAGHLADAFNVRGISGRAVGQQSLDEIAYELNEVTGGNRATPILVYCHHTSCGLSYYAGVRIAGLGYTSVLWMRDGVKGWKAAGYPVSSAPSRWTENTLPAFKAWMDCVAAQRVPDTGDPERLLAGIRSACRAQERAQRATYAPWRSSFAVDAGMAEIAKMIDSTAKNRIESAQAPAKRAAEKAKDEAEKLAKAAEWRRKQGIGLPASQLMDGFQYCFAATDAADFTRTYYYSSVYPTRIAKTNAADLHYYNRLNILLDPVDGEKYAAYVKAAVKPARGAFGGCVFATTLAGAQAELARSRSRDGARARDLPWRPQ